MAADVYTVSLTVGGPGGTDTETRPGYVEALPQPTPTPTPTPIPTPTPTPTPRPCPLRRTLRDSPQGIVAYQSLRDEVFARSPAGRRYTALYEKHASEVARLLAADPQLAAQAATLLCRWQPAVEGLVAVERGVAVSTEATERRVTTEDVAAARAVLESLAEHGSPQLQADLEPVLSRMDDFAGRTPAEIWGMLKEGERRLYLPLVLSNVEGLILNNAGGGAEGQGGKGAGERGSVPPGWPDLTLLLLAPLAVLALGQGRKRQRWVTPLAVVLLAVLGIGASVVYGSGAEEPGSGGVEEQRSALPAPAVAALPASSVQAAGTITTTRVITYILRCAQDRLYDPLNRLTGADYSTGESFAYQYDAVGNRTALTKTTPLDETTVTTYTYDTANRLLVSHSPGHLVTYGWDARGNLISDGTFTYTYSAAGRLVRAESLTATLVYTYTADGLLPAGAVVSSQVGIFSSPDPFPGLRAQPLSLQPWTLAK